MSPLLSGYYPQFDVMALKNSFFSLYRKRFPAKGVILDDVRGYVSGDDTRFINWNVSARMGSLFINNIRGDSGNDIVFAFDISESMKFTTRKQSKFNLASEVLMDVSQLAERSNDKVGMLLFSDKIEKYFPPRRNTEIFRHALTEVSNPGEKMRTGVPQAIQFLHKVIKKRSIIIFICDIFGLAFNRKSVLAGLHVLRMKHDVIILTMIDDNDMPMVSVGKIVIEDSETGEILEIDTDDTELISRIKAQYFAYQNVVLRDVKNLGIKTFLVNTKDSVTGFLTSLLRR
jgi:uncharacterized protein (DUF58 family)